MGHVMSLLLMNLVSLMIIGRGRPVVDIQEGQLQLLYNEGWTAGNIAKYLGCSKSLIYKRLYELNLPMRKRYSTISDQNLHETVCRIHSEHPHAGYVVGIVSAILNFVNLILLICFVELLIITCAMPVFL